MKKLRNILLVLSLGIFLAACSYTRPYMVTDNSVGTKVGKAAGTCYLGYLCFDADWSIQTAAKNGGIKKIATVDIKVTNVLGLIMTYETIVTGD